MKNILVILALTAVFVGCDSEKEHQNALMQLIGSEVKIPEDLTYQVQGFPVVYDFGDCDYRIVVYVDSAGCTPCKMKLGVWGKIMADYNTIPGKDVNFLMIVGPGAETDAAETIARDAFDLPVSFDTEGRFIENNALPEDETYHTLLIDSEDKVVAVGNPATNPKVRKLFMDIVCGGAPMLTKYCSQSTSRFAVVERGDTVIRYFSLVNNSDSLLTIQEIVPSCDCISATASTDTISPSKSSVITVCYVADSVPGAVKRYIDVFYNEKDSPERLTLCGYIK